MIVLAARWRVGSRAPIRSARKGRKVRAQAAKRIADVYAVVFRALPFCRPRCALAVGPWVVERDGSAVTFSPSTTNPRVHA